MTRRRLLRTVTAGLAAALALSGCTTVSEVGAVTAMPLAAVGDTMLLPLQGAQRASKHLIQAGDEHYDAVTAAHEPDDVTLPADQASSAAYYVPGALLYPFGVVAPHELYPMTKACVGVLRVAEAPTNLPAHVYEDIPDDEFEEW